MFRRNGFILLLTFIAFAGNAQDTLPRFTLINRGNNRIVTSWTNPYGTAIKQLSIQRSLESTQNFKTILTFPDPTVPQNGYVDTKAPNDHMFYRLFLLFDGGKYLFSKARRPTPDTVKVKALAKEGKPGEQVQEEIKKGQYNLIKEISKQETTEESKPENKELAKRKEIPELILYIKRNDSIIGQIGERSFKRFRDSLAIRTKDTLGFIAADTLLIRTFVPKEIWKVSKYVFTEKDGNVRIALPEATSRKYALKFFDTDNSPLFEVKQIRDTLLILDKSNFLHSGWFKFELYEDGQLKERQKLFVPKEF